MIVKVTAVYAPALRSRGHVRSARYTYFRSMDEAMAHINEFYAGSHTITVEVWT